MFFDRNGPMLMGAREAKRRPHPALQILIFFLVMLVGQFAAGIISGMAMAPVIIAEYLPLLQAGDTVGYMAGIMEFSANPPDYVAVLSLFTTAFVTAAAIIYCRFIERRSFVSMGLGKARALSDYALGWLAGAGMFAAAALVCVGTGTLRFSVSPDIKWGYIALFFLGFLVQGMSEEVLVRGYLMTSLTARAPVWFAVLSSSLIFAGMHLLNNGITPLAFLNLALFGAFAALFTLRFQRLWGICALHSAWNFVQGNVLGIKVSGGGYTASLFMAEPVGPALVNGGDFGLEGGLAVTAVLVLGCLAVLLLPRKKGAEDVL